MFARTSRLTLRPGWPEDAPALATAIAHEAVAFKLARLPWPYTVDHAAEWLRRPQRLRDQTLLILAHEGPTPRLIGAVGIHPIELGGPSDTAGHEIGYWLTPSAWGRGYATEAGLAMLAIAQRAMGLRRLYSGHFLDNPASGRVLAKLGFQAIGVEMLHCLSMGIDKPCMKLVRDLDPAGISAAPERLAA